jgi:uncharacterized UPF0160 family protein
MCVSAQRAPTLVLLLAAPIATIGTHDGSFHADEALACFLLKLLPHARDAAIVRTRDAARLAACDAVVDVGGVFDAAALRFDHHQRTFTHTMATLCPGKPWTTRLSSAGLVFAHYGRAAIAQLCGTGAADTETLFDQVLFFFCFFLFCFVLFCFIPD